jgi:tungstate transport system substrate-binding protein
MSLIGFKTRNIYILSALIIIVASSSFFILTQPKTRENLIVSTTTSLYETGVLDVIKTMFENEQPGYNVSFISQGTGLAIETAKRGDADMILVHSPSQEVSFLESRYGVNRKIFAYNFFIIVGPEDDPAEIIGMNPTDALIKVSEEGIEGDALWVSRGDNSGTHSKEKALWKATGLELEILKKEVAKTSNSPWYIEAGAGMTATLQLTNQKEAYTLTDVASYLKNYKNGNIESVKVVDSGKETLNVYSAIICDPRKNPDTKFEIAVKFVEFLVSEDIQSLLVEYGKDEFGATLFKPWLPELKYPDSDIIQWVEEYAYLDGAECPLEYRYRSENLYQ